MYAPEFELDEPEAEPDPAEPRAPPVGDALSEHFEAAHTGVSHRTYTKSARIG